MSIALVGTPTENFTSSLVTHVSDAFNVNTGESISVLLGVDSSSVSVLSVLDTAGNTYLLDQNQANGCLESIYHCENAIANAANVVTVTYSSGCSGFICTARWSGVLASSALEVVGEGAGNSFNPQVLSPVGGISTTTPDCVIITSAFNTAFSITTPPTGFTTLGGNPVLGNAYKILSGTATNVTADQTSSSQALWAMGIIALKPAASTGNSVSTFDQMRRQ